jgi:hypothetical protein
MAKEKRTREERSQARDVRRDINRAERNEIRRDRQLRKVNKTLAESDAKIGYNKKPQATTDFGPAPVSKSNINVLMRGTDQEVAQGLPNAGVEASAQGGTKEALNKAENIQLEYKKGQALLNNIDNTTLNNATIQSQVNNVPTAGMQLASAVSNNPDSTLTDLNKVSDASKQVNNEQEKQNAVIASEAINTNNAIAQTPRVDMPAVGAEVAANEVANAEQGGIPSMPIKPAQAIDNAGTIPSERIAGDGSTALQQMQGGNATFDQGLTKDKVQNQISDEALKNLSSSPVLAIEKLGVQDYFPNAGENIAAGSYSGKYIGNTTIFAAPGARIPFGLYDARMRALKEAAAEKQKAVDKMLTAPQTAPQNQEQYNNEYFFPKQNYFIEKHKGDFNEMMSDPEYRQFMANAEAKARNTTQNSTWARTVADTFQKPGVYIPKGMMQDVEKILYGSPEEYGAYLRGEDSPYTRAMSNVRVYQDIMPSVEELMKTVTDPARLTERPFNFRTGGKYDDPEFVAERNKFMERVMNGDPSLGADVYASGIIKYFDVTDIEQSIRAEVLGRNGSEEQIPYAIDYALGMIPKESIKFSYETIRTDELEYARIREAQRQFNINDENIKASYARTIHEIGTNRTNPQTGKTFDEELAELSNSKASKEEKARKLKSLYAIYFGATSGTGKVTFDENGTPVTYVPMNGEATHADPNSVTFEVKYKDITTGKPVTKIMTAAEIAQTPPNIKLSIGGQQIQNNSDYASIRVKPIEAEVRNAYFDGDGYQKYITTENMGQYARTPEGRRITYTKIINKAYIVREGHNAKKEKYTEVVPVPGVVSGGVINIANPTGQQDFDSRAGYTRKQSAEAQLPSQTMTISSSSENR